MAVTTLLKPSDYVVVTYKDQSQAGITITSVSSTEIVGVQDGSDVQDHIKIDDVQIIQKSERSPGRTVLLIIGATVAGILAFLAIIGPGFQG